MALESKHIALLRSCSRWLKTRSSSPYFERVGLCTMMAVYAKDLDEIADELEKLNLPKTVVTLDDIFGKSNNDT